MLFKKDGVIHGQKKRVPTNNFFLLKMDTGQGPRLKAQILFMDFF